MPCCIGQAGIYSSEIQLQTTGVSPTGITAGSYNLVVHAPEWAPNILVQAAAALKDALQGQFGDAWEIAFGSYTVVDKPNGDTIDPNALGSETIGTSALTAPHKDLVYPFTLTAKTAGQAYPQLEEIALIIAAIAAVLIVFGILWIVVEIDKSLGGLGGIFWILLAIAALVLVTQPETRKKAEKTARKGYTTAEAAVSKVAKKI